MSNETTATTVAPAISFAIPYYRNQQYLLEAIDSVRNQTVGDWELIVVDDAGPEPAGALVESIRDQRITYVRNEANLGLAGNWNECVRLSRAPIVNVLHADDRLRPQYAERVLDAARQHPHVVAFFTDVSVIGADGQPKRTMADLAKHLVRRPRHDYELCGDRALAGLLAGNYIYCPTMSLRRSLVGPAPYDARWRFVLDLDFAVKQLVAGGSLFGIRSPLFEYRRHGSSQTSLQTEDASRFVEELAYSRQMASTTAAMGWTRSSRAARHRVLLRAHMLVRIGGDLAGRRRAAARQNWNILWNDLRG